ncbi:MAG TPA: hypothetical protein VN033_15065 [Vulgatibacter sp.]|nr:hypothetical protein [Vulgatibacter sp.]
MDGSLIEGPLLSFFVAAVFLAAVGQGATGQVFGPVGPRPTTGWRETWRRTMWAHPILGGVALGFLRLPAPEALGGGVAGAAVWYAAAGALALPIYRWLRQLLERPQPPST